MVSLIASKECLLICLVFTSLTDTIGTATPKPSVLKKTSFPQWPWTISMSNWINSNGNGTYYNNYTTPSGDGLDTITSFKWTTSLRSTLLQIKTSESDRVLNQANKFRSNGNSNQTGTSGSKGNLNQTGTDSTNTTVETPITVAAKTIVKTITTVRTTTSPNCRILVPTIIYTSFIWHSFLIGSGGLLLTDVTLTNFTADVRTDVCKPTFPRFITRRYRGFNKVEMWTHVDGEYRSWLVADCKNQSSLCTPTVNISLPLNESITRVILFFSKGNDKTSLAMIVSYETATTPKPKIKLISDIIGFITNVESTDLLKILKSRYLRYYKLIRRHL